MDPAVIQIGSKDCTYSAIQRSLEHTKSLNKFLEKWVDLAISLEISNQTIHQLTERMQNNTITIYETLEILLQEWKVANPDNATLFNLVEKLREIGLYDFANALFMRVPVQTFQVNAYQKEVNLKISNELWNEADAITHGKSCKPLLSGKPSQKRWRQNRAMKSLVVYIVLLVLLPLMFVLGELHNASQNPNKDIESTSSLKLLEAFSTSKNPPNRSTREDPNSKSAKLTNDAEQKEAPACFKIIADSFQEYQNQIELLDKNQAACVTFHVDKNMSLNQSTILSHTHLVTELELSGEINIEFVLDLIRQFSNIRKLEFTIQKSIHNNMCDINSKEETNPLGNDQRDERKKLRLSGVKYLHMQGLNECPNLINNLTKRVIMDRIEKIRISKSVINSDNVKAVQMILEKTRFSLKSITFYQAHIEVPLFNGFRCVLDRVTEAFFEHTLTNKKPEMLFTNAFYKVLPNIEILTYKNSYIDSPHLLEVLKLKEIRNLEIGLYIPSGQKFFPRILAEKLEKVEKVTIHFKFANPLKCYVVGAESVAQMFDLKIFSDGCEIIYETETEIQEPN